MNFFAIYFLTTLEAVRTSVLSHRWKNVWASVPNLHLDELEFYKHCLISWEEYETSYFEEFVDDLLSNRGEANIHTFRVTAVCREMNSFRIDGCISAAIRHNVVELDLSIRKPTSPHLVIPVGIFTCNTLTSLKLRVCSNVSAMTPNSHCFSSLKFLHVKVGYPDSAFMDKFFSCLPVLEDLIIDGYVADTTTYNVNISAPKLKRLQIRLIVATVVDNFVNYECQIFVSADTPNLEEVDTDYDCLVSYSLKNAKCLRKAKIEFHVEDLVYRYYFPSLPDRICQLFADIRHAKHLKVSVPIFTALGIRYHSLMLTFSNLSHLELELPTCQCLQALTTLLKISPKLEHLKISAIKNAVSGSYSYCNDVNIEHGWDAPESVPVCLISHLKTICLWEFKGCLNEMEAANYLVRHGNVLNQVTVYIDREMELQSPMTLWSKLSKFFRGSKDCKVQLQTIV